MYHTFFRFIIEKGIINPNTNLKNFILESFGLPQKKALPHIQGLKKTKKEMESPVTPLLKGMLRLRKRRKICPNNKNQKIRHAPHGK